MFCFVLLLLSRFDAILQRQSKHKDKKKKKIFFLVKYTLIRKCSTLGSPGLWRTRGKRRKLTNISRHLYIPLDHCLPPQKKTQQQQQNNKQTKKPKKQQQKRKKPTKNQQTNKQTTTTKTQHQQKTPLFCSNSFF